MRNTTIFGWLLSQPGAQPPHTDISHNVYSLCSHWRVLPMIRPIRRQDLPMQQHITNQRTHPTPLQGPQKKLPSPWHRQKAQHRSSIRVHEKHQKAHTVHQGIKSLQQMGHQPRPNRSWTHLHSKREQQENVERHQID